MLDTRPLLIKTDFPAISRGILEGKGVRRKQKNAYFSINKYGEDKAKRLAIKARRSSVRENRIS